MLSFFKEQVTYFLHYQPVKSFALQGSAFGRNLTGRVYNDQNFLGRHIVWIFEFWSLGFVCYLEFDVWDFNI
jgi:hypothetical protein